MENRKQKSLKTEFFAAVSITLLGVALASALTVWGCLRFQKWLVPDTHFVMIHMYHRTSEGTSDKMQDAIPPEMQDALPSKIPSDTSDKLSSGISDGMEEFASCRFEVDSGIPEAIPYIRTSENGLPVTENFDPRNFLFSVESADYGIGWRGPRRRLAYIGAGIAMGVLPLVYSVTGFLFCALWFYRRKLSPAITVLEEATQHIANQDLDFAVCCSLENELGRLCLSFEKMRETLKENNQKLWKIIEERKLIQASVAHDLRNPIAILKGYTEYLQLHLQTGDLKPQRLREVTVCIENAANRLEQYTESMRTINQLDEIPLNTRQISSDQLIQDLTSDLTLMAQEAGKTLNIKNGAPSCMISVDAALLYRILENILSNALRFAKKEIGITFWMQDRTFAITVMDDGDGFPEGILKNKNRLLMPAADENGHCGLGLTISRLLSQKHGGSLELSNGAPCGAVVKILLTV